MSVRQAQREIDSREFAEWIAYDRIDPFGEERADWRVGQLTAMVANLFTKRGQAKAKATDFMYQDKPKRQTLAQQRSIFAAFAAAHNAHQARKGKG